MEANYKEQRGYDFESEGGWQRLDGDIGQDGGKKGKGQSDVILYQ